jgi:hypothetical protein
MLMLISAMLAAQAATPPPVRFTPVAVRVSFRVAPGGVVSDCSVALSGNPEPHWHDDPCGNINSAPFLDVMGIDPQSSGRMTLLLALETNGRAVDPGEVPGRLSFRSQVRFTLAESGAIAACEADAPIGGGERIDLCRTGFPTRPEPFVRAGGAQEPRRGTLSFSLYR